MNGTSTVVEGNAVPEKNVTDGKIEDVNGAADNNKSE